MEESRVDAIEWSFDALFKVKEVPPWFLELLSVYSKEKRLIGHGVFFSLFTGKWLQEQEDWLKQLNQTCKGFQFDHVTEHFGFMTGKDFHHGAPLNIPYTKTTLAIGRDRLKRIYQACMCPVGLENLAFSYSLDEVKRHGDFLEKLVEPINGFIILDLHNLYCQIHNFDISFDEIMALYPLARVREIHISGGSWDDSHIETGRKVRRDTHDDAVPKEVFKLLELAIAHCPNLKYVVLEQLGNGLTSKESKKSFYNDFLEMENIVKGKRKIQRPQSANTFLPALALLPGDIVEDEILYQQQLELSFILESSASYENVVLLLNKSSLANSAWKIEDWKPYMIETAIKIAQKWKK